MKIIFETESTSLGVNNIEHFCFSVREQDLYQDIQDMEWTVSSPSSADGLLKKINEQSNPKNVDFEDIRDSSFHTDLMNMATDNLHDPTNFQEVADGSFHEEDSLIRDIQGVQVA